MEYIHYQNHQSFLRNLTFSLFFFFVPFVVLGIELRALHMMGKCTTVVLPDPSPWFFETGSGLELLILLLGL
jgi:hypothetical protein